MTITTTPAGAIGDHYAVMDAVGGARVAIDHPGPVSVALSVSGEIDLVTVGALSDCLLAAVDLPGRRELLVDLSGVSFLGAVGIEVFAQARTRATERAKTMHLVAVSRVARRVLDLTGALRPTGAGGCFDAWPILPSGGIREPRSSTAAVDETVSQRPRFPSRSVAP